MADLRLKPSDDQWIDADEFCSITGWAKGSFLNARSRGEDLPAVYKFGHKLRLRRSDVDSWLEKFRHESAATRLKKRTK
jgi:hypothetical protein